MGLFGFGKQKEPDPKVTVFEDMKTMMRSIIRAWEALYGVAYKDEPQMTKDFLMMWLYGMTLALQQKVGYPPHYRVLKEVFYATMGMDWGYDILDAQAFVFSMDDDIRRGPENNLGYAIISRGAASLERYDALAGDEEAQAQGTAAEMHGFLETLKEQGVRLVRA